MMNSNNLYHTFFLSGTHWSNPREIIEFARWIAPAIKTDKAFLLSARKVEDLGKRKGSVQGDYFKLQGSLDKFNFAHVLIASRNWDSRGGQLSFEAELIDTRLTTRAQGLQAQDGGIANDVEEIPFGNKCVSMSIRKDVWRECEKSGISQEISRRWEQLFITVGALYGYCTSTKLPTGGKFALIGGKQGPDYPRITDFDYSRFAEAVYPSNYISSIQMEKSGSRDRILAASGDVRSRILSDFAGKEIGVAVSLANDSESTKQHCAEIFGDLLWKPGLGIVNR